MPRFKSPGGSVNMRAYKLWKFAAAAWQRANEVTAISVPGAGRRRNCLHFEVFSVARIG
jgi:hypothetical protein